MVPNWDQEIDSILASVETAMSEVEALAKSETGKTDAPAGTDQKDQVMSGHQDANGGHMKKDDLPPSDDKKPEGDEDEAPEAPAADAGDSEAPAAEGTLSDAPAPKDDAPKDDASEGEQALEQESPDAPISDEELKEIYGSMPPEELQRHFMVIREILRGAQPAAAPAPAPEMGKSEGRSAESKKIAELEKKNQELEKSLGRLAMVMETMFKPERKAVTDIAYIRKSEADNAEDRQLSKEEIRALANEKCKDRSLSKSDREALNDYLLRGESSDKVMKIIRGGR